MKCLIVDDNRNDLELIAYELRGMQRSIEPQIARSRAELIGCLEQYQFDVAVLDYWLPGLPWPDSMQLVREHNADCAVIVVSGADSDTPRAYEAIRQGADDFVDKGKLYMLPHAIRRELIRRLAVKEREASLERISSVAPYRDLKVVE